MLTPTHLIFCLVPLYLVTHNISACVLNGLSVSKNHSSVFKSPICLIFNHLFDFLVTKALCVHISFLIPQTASFFDTLCMSFFYLSHNFTFADLVCVCVFFFSFLFGENGTITQVRFSIIMFFFFLFV